MYVGFPMDEMQNSETPCIDSLNAGIGCPAYGVYGFGFRASGLGVMALGSAPNVNSVTNIGALI